jgi:general secretion pathway protein C
MRSTSETLVARDLRLRAGLVAGVLAISSASFAGAGESAGSPRLLGTVVSSDAARSLAVIEQGGAPRVLRTGGDLAGATVIEIRSDAVVLRRGGRVETLILAEVSRPSVAAVSGVPASPAPSDADDAAAVPESHAESPSPRASRSSPRARRSSVAAGRAPAAASAPSEAEAARSNDQVLADLAAQARFAPVMDNDGKLRGVAVMNIVSDSMLERLGLQSDDVVTAIQGVPIDSSGRAMSVARGLGMSQPVKLDIERRGVATVVVVDPRSLQRR